LLPVIIALSEEGTVSAVARRLGMSQPAVSRALGQLRHTFADPLFVRTARGMEPTPRAVELLRPVRAALGIVSGEILQSAVFDPAAAERTVAIALSDAGEMITLPSILGHLRTAAPNINVRSVSLPPAQLQRAMEIGEVDLALGYFPDLKGNNFYQQRLYSHGFTCLLRTGHPIKGPRMTLKQFKLAVHAVVHAEGRSQEILERFLVKRRIHRRAVLETPHFLSIPHIIARSDLVATVPIAVATAFGRFMGIRTIVPPFDVGQVELRQHWHRKFHHDPLNRWLRGMIHTVINESIEELKG
jgi:DNA-binding transcriptional LysR family regulator